MAVRLANDHRQHCQAPARSTDPRIGPVLRNPSQGAQALDPPAGRGIAGVITDLLALSLLILFAVLGFRQPYVALCGVIWADLYKPQLLSQSFLADRPISMIMTALFALSMLVNFKDLRWPRHLLYVFLVATFMAWITLTTYLAQFQMAAWFKWDAAFKTMLLAYFIPFVLSNRQQIELFLWTLAATMGFFFFLAGVKSLFGGGGYGVSLISDNELVIWNEGSTLATQAIAAIPLFYYAAQHSQLAQKIPALKFILLGLAVSGVALLIGTQARTGLVALLALILLALRYTRSRGTIIAICIAVPLFATPFVPQAWFERMTTITSTKQESSAQGRVAVWRWTIDYVNDEHPITGGGFNSYFANAGQLGKYAKEGEVVIETKYGKAFHNIFFEVFGEHGYVGLVLFCFIVGHTLLLSRRISKDESRDPWLRAFGLCAFMSTAVYCVGGLFIGVAFYPWLYYMYGLVVALAGVAAPAAGSEEAAALVKPPRSRRAIARAPATTAAP
jgi:probable O-glycosylation ligase (exosortase A-associated)